MSSVNHLVLTNDERAEMRAWVDAALLGKQLPEGEWVPGLLAGITLAMGILPEEIPVIMTVFMALGARRIRRVDASARGVFAGFWAVVPWHQ